MDIFDGVELVAMLLVGCALWMQWQSMQDLKAELQLLRATVESRLPAYPRP